MKHFPFLAFPRRRTGDSLHPGRLFLRRRTDVRGDCSRCHRNHPALRQHGKRDGKRQPLLLRCPRDECVTGEVTIDGTDYLFDYTGSAERPAGGRLNGDTPLLRPGHRRTGLRAGWSPAVYRYYADSDTGKLTGEQTLDEHRYQFDPDCGTQTVGVCTFADGTVSYYNSIDGSIQTGWQKDGRDIYYFSPDTETALVGMQQLDGSSYYFESDGKLVRSQTVLIDGVTYRAADDGKLSTEHHPGHGQVPGDSRTDGRLSSALSTPT